MAQVERAGSLGFGDRRALRVQQRHEADRGSHRHTRLVRQTQVEQPDGELLR